MLRGAEVELKIWCLRHEKCRKFGVGVIRCNTYHPVSCDSHHRKLLFLVNVFITFHTTHLKTFKLVESKPGEIL